ncbi:hypothetical protein BC940DRAFT_306538 [Gongronella butleri]|nr:hypothetical protein BC940DRAFT_306538 [Gongronella butleri]
MDSLIPADCHHNLQTHHVGVGRGTNWAFILLCLVAQAKETSNCTDTTRYRLNHMNRHADLNAIESIWHECARHPNGQIELKIENGGVFRGIDKEIGCCRGQARTFYGAPVAAWNMNCVRVQLSKLCTKSKFGALASYFQINLTGNRVAAVPFADF